MKKAILYILLSLLGISNFYSQSTLCSKCAKVIYIVDNSGSVNTSEFNDMKTSLDNVSSYILSTYSNVEIAVVQYGVPSGPAEYNVTVPFTSNLTTVQSWSRFYPSGNDHLPGSLAQMRLDGIWQAGGVLDLETDSCEVSFLVFTDALKDAGVGGSSLVNNGGFVPTAPATILPGFGEYNHMKTTYGAEFTVYHVAPDAASINGAAAIASVGGSYAGPGIDANAGDPEGSGTLPRRYTNGPFLLTNPQVLQISLDVNPGGGPSVIITKSNDSICIGESVSFTSSGAAPYNRAWWNLGDGTLDSNVLSLNHTYPSSGTYYITHIYENTEGCADTAYDTLIVSPSVQANFFIDTVCAGLPNNFTNSSTGPVSSTQWTFGDGTSGTQVGPVFTHTYPGAGFYTIQLIVGGNGCYDTLTKVAGVNLNPVPDFTFVNQCLGAPYQFTNTTTIGGLSAPATTFYLWHLGNSTTSLDTDPNTTYNTSGNINVRLVATTPEGCTRDTTKQINVYPIPVANFTSDTVCLGLPTSFTDLSTVGTGTITGWQWYGDSNYFIQNPQHIYDQSGSFSMTLIVTSSNGCTDTVVDTGLVYTLPIADFTYEPSVVSVFNTDACFINMSTNANSYLWHFGFHSLSSISDDPCVQFPLGDTGTYYVELIARNQFGCYDTLIKPLPIQDEYTLYVPNSFTPDGDGINDIFIPFYGGMRDVKLYVFNRWGEQLFFTERIDQGWEGNHEGENCKQDVYVYRVFATDIFGEKHEKIGHVSLLR